MARSGTQVAANRRRRRQIKGALAPPGRAKMRKAKCDSGTSANVLFCPFCSFCSSWEIGGSVVETPNSATVEIINRQSFFVVSSCSSLPPISFFFFFFCLSTSDGAAFVSFTNASTTTILVCFFGLPIALTSINPDLKHSTPASSGLASPMHLGASNSALAMYAALYGADHARIVKDHYLIMPSGTATTATTKPHYPEHIMATSQVPTALGLPQSPPASSTPWPLPGPLPVLPSLPCFLGRVGSSSLCFSAHCPPKSSNCIRCLGGVHASASSLNDALVPALKPLSALLLAPWSLIIEPVSHGPSWPPPGLPTAISTVTSRPSPSCRDGVKAQLEPSPIQVPDTDSASVPKAHRAPVVLAYGISSTAICRPPGAKAKAHSSSVSKSCRISDDDFLPLLTPFGGKAFYNEIKDTT
ncbi:uncharacterized protein CLUP02_09373 [Colletotrichum lupini]|uniref:Uncharacterized protein n=1 Tax=Colletotrichum lupini TaxID=145971 RepID=A0A9Q8SUM0_9PEZI|nr:uncharacterized protein CLUP02_09373 [Colletotrichum lupini]UQC83877.1 hypothetical protein CLUP02_09373 [Colletotrichum lupini]